MCELKIIKMMLELRMKAKLELVIRAMLELGIEANWN